MNAERAAEVQRLLDEAAAPALDVEHIDGLAAQALIDRHFEQPKEKTE